MSKTDTSQRLLNMLKSEERKDSQQVEQIKKSYIKEISKMSKEDLFPKPKKLTIWQKIKVILLGK
jgi:hypothetical protein